MKDSKLCTAYEYKLVPFRDCPLPADMPEVDEPKLAAEYWRTNVATTPHFNPDIEHLVVLLLNSRFRIKGHVVVSSGILDSCQMHPREIFRHAIVGAAHSIVLMHNHPSCESSPSPNDILGTQRLLVASSILGIPIHDHVIVGGDGHSSMRALGHFELHPLAKALFGEDAKA